MDNPNAPTRETVLDVKHYTDKTFKFTTTRPKSFRFRSGEFIMLGLDGEKKPLLRAYSVASPSWADEVEFYSIKVENGPLTSRLQHIKPGDEIVLGGKPVGSLVLDALLPGKRLFMFSTGTGIAPFASLVRDPETYEKFDAVILTHTCRKKKELAYGVELVENVSNDPLVGEFVGEKLTHITSVTREDYPLKHRITHLIETDRLFEIIGTGPLSPETDRAMICGSLEMTRDIAALMGQAGLKEGANSNPGSYVIEKAFVG